MAKREAGNGRRVLLVEFPGLCREAAQSTVVTMRTFRAISAAAAVFAISGAQALWLGGGLTILSNNQLDGKLQNPLKLLTRRT